jgi:membrane protein DedA with SNARE-associated domain
MSLSFLGCYTVRSGIVLVGHHVPWVFALTYLGFILGENWDRIGYYLHYLHYLDYAVALAFIVGAIYLVLRWRS